MKASILFDNKIFSSVSASPKAFADVVLWNEWLDFDVPLQDLPRGTKLGFTINEIPPVATDTGAEQQTSSRKARRPCSISSIFSSLITGMFVLFNLYFPSVVSNTFFCDTLDPKAAPEPSCRYLVDVFIHKISNSST